MYDGVGTEGLFSAWLIQKGHSTFDCAGDFVQSVFRS